MAQDLLPEQFRFSHDFCFFLHDQLVETLNSGLEAEIFNIKVKFRKKSHIKAIQGLSGEDFISYLENNGYKIDVDWLFYKQVCRALLSDFLHFVFEALQCSKKGKLTVAYALLRKPFKENLLFLEWMLAEPEDFLKRFDLETKTRFTFPTDVAKDKTIEIIEKALKKTKYAKVFDPKVLYDLRHDKSVYLGLEPLWQKANHLITTYKYLETRKGNFNFVFANSSHKKWLWKKLYDFVPILLYYSVEIVEAIISKFAKPVGTKLDITPLRTSIGMFLYLKKSGHKRRADKVGKQLKVTLNRIGLICDNCGTTLRIDIYNLRRMYEEGTLKCYNCKRIDNLGYLFKGTYDSRNQNHPNTKASG
jgi:hypothetical protein